MNGWMTQEEAVAALGVRAQTLYAYVSRGRIETCADPANPRRSLYRGEDITSLLRKRDVGRKRENIAASAIAWGEPIIATHITTIVRGRLYYRGRDAVHLSETATLEEAAQLLWQAETQPHFAAVPPEIAASPRARAYDVLGEAAASAAPAHALSPATMRHDAAGLVGRLGSAFVDIAPADLPLHQRIAQAWRCADKADLLRRVLVILADQELTSSAFAARVTASTGASLAACVLTGLAALSGPLHGDATLRVQALVDDARRSGAEEAARRWLSAGMALPGFGHPLYPQGDPRAAYLLGVFEPPAEIRALVEIAHRLTGLRPTIDVALAAVVEHCHLPDGSAFALFAIGRSIGWLAHAIEQIEHGGLIRPRARYVGPAVMG